LLILATNKFSWVKNISLLGQLFVSSTDHTTFFAPYTATPVVKNYQYNFISSKTIGYSYGVGFLYLSWEYDYASQNAISIYPFNDTATGFTV